MRHLALTIALIGLAWIPAHAGPEAGPSPDRSIGAASEAARPGAATGAGSFAPRDEVTREEKRPGGLGVAPAQEVVRMRCPEALTYAGTPVKTGDTAGWQFETSLASAVITEFRFVDIKDLSDGYRDWRGASEIVCRYADESYDRIRTVTRKVHPSGTPYRCKIDRKDRRAVECRLSITPDFPGN